MSDQIVFTFGVAKIDLAKQFYQEVLGLASAQDYPQFVSFKAADSPTSMALYTGDALAYDVAVAERAEGFRGAMFSCIVDNDGRVDQVPCSAQGCWVVRNRHRPQTPGCARPSVP